MTRAVTCLVLMLAVTCVLAAAAFVIWALNAAPAEAQAYAAAVSNPGVVVRSHDGFITIRPATKSPEIGFSFYPGARVEPAAYVSKLTAVAAAAHVDIVIGRPRLNFAALSINQADEMRAALPDVRRWYVGGHSLGGSIACVYARRHPGVLEGVVLFGTYCGVDISRTSLRVLTIAGERDGVFPPSKIQQRVPNCRSVPNS